MRYTIIGYSRTKQYTVQSDEEHSAMVVYSMFKSRGNMHTVELHRDGKLVRKKVKENGKAFPIKKRPIICYPT